jgi:ATP-dependent DNA ligase
MTLQDIRDAKPMKYWSLSPTASQNQKDKLAKLLDSSQYFLTLKRDGAWYKYSKGDGEVLLQSRTVSRTTGDYVDKADRVPHVIEALDVLPDNTVLVGEICYADTGRISSDVVSIMGCLADKAVKRQEEEKLVYYVFDVLMLNGEEIHKLPALKRMEVLAKIFKDYELGPYIKKVEIVLYDFMEQVQDWLAKGEEGGVLINKDAPYAFGKKPAWSSIKIKQSLSEDIDLVIMSTTEPIEHYTGKYPVTHPYWINLRTGEKVEGLMYGQAGYRAVTSTYFNGLVGGLQLGAYYNGRLVEVCRVSNLTDDLREDLTFSFDKYKGSVVEVSAMSVDKERKSLRHPKLVRLRPDKDAKECLYNEIFSS